MSGFLFTNFGARLIVPKFVLGMLIFASSIAISSIVAASTRTAYYSTPLAKFSSNANNASSATTTSESSLWTLRNVPASYAGKLQPSRRVDSQLPSPDSGFPNPVTHLSVPVSHQPQTENNGYYYDSSNHLYHHEGHQTFHNAHAPSHYHQYHSHKHGGEDSSFEVEDKVFSKTVVATKALKIGKLIFTLVLVLVVLLIAVIGKLGVALSPVVLPFAVFPIGVIALLLFVPLFFLFVPLAATGVIGEGRRRRRSVEPIEAHSNIFNDILAKLDVNF